MVRPQFELDRFEWPTRTGSSSTSHTSHWLHLLRKRSRSSGCRAYAPSSAETHSYYKYVTAEWARKWPVEEVWVARKRG